MAKKPTGRKVATKRNPLMQEVTPLDFDNAPEEELLALTPEQESDRFMSRWLEIFTPYEAYPRVFSNGNKQGERTLHDIKLYFTKYVAEGEWSEKKYVMVINTLCEARQMVNHYTLDKMGVLYDDERLPVQIRLRRDKEKE